VLVCVADDEVQAYARARLSSARIDMQRVRFIEVEYDDTWLRDSGPITLHGKDGFRLLDFRFTGWGGKFEAGRDDRLVEALDDLDTFANNDRQAIDFALEGGAIETDGAGTLLTTWKCLHERHPAVSREELDDRMAGWLQQDRVLWLDHGYLEGAGTLPTTWNCLHERDPAVSREVLDDRMAGWLQQDRVLWLDHGYLEGDDTDAHIDTLARFAAPDAIVYQACDDPADSHYPELQAMAAELASLRTRNGAPYRLFPLPWPQPVIDQDRRLAASYANFLIINGAVLMPAYGDPADDGAAAVLAKAFPDREIVPVPCRPLIWQNGSLH